VPHLPRAFGAGGGISSTVGEVLAMAHVLLHGGVAANGNRILPAGLVREMTSSRVPVPDPYMFGPEWALGLIVCDWRGETVFASDGSTIGQNARLRVLPGAGIAVAVLTNGGPRESFAREVLRTVLGELDAPTVPDPPVPDPGLALDPSRYVGVYERPGARYEVGADAGRLHLTLVIDPVRAGILGRPERVRRALLPISDTHFLVPSDDPLEDDQTLALHDVRDGVAQYLHTNSRVHPRSPAQPGRGAPSSRPTIRST
jgi:CubicO group peptidase (beta-lactamase class C family)